MARHNDVRLYGCVATHPKVTKDEKTGELIRAAFNLTVIRSDRPAENTESEELTDWPLIITKNPEFCAMIAKLKMYDVVEVQGVLTTARQTKFAFCTACGAVNKVEGNVFYVYPMFIKKRNDKIELTEKQAIQILKENRRISNNVTLVGNLCKDPQYFHGGQIEYSAYQIAVNRKLFLKEENPNVKVDYPVIRSYSKQAQQDELCLRSGSSVLIEGYLHTRKYNRKTICTSPACKKEFLWEDNIIEVIPYNGGVDYCANYTDPETANKKREEEKMAAGKKLMNSLKN